MAFSDRSFAQRYLVLGDECEGIFEKWAASEELAFIRYGLNRPPFNSVGSMPAKIRMSPDYLCEHKTKQGKIKHFFIECKGCGFYLKIKQETLTNLHEWNQDLPVFFYVYSSKTHSYAVISFEDMVALCRKSPQKEFSNDHKVYFQIHPDDITWIALDESFKENSND
jgi:hypothetical protein